VISKDTPGPELIAMGSVVGATVVTTLDVVAGRFVVVPVLVVVDVVVTDVVDVVDVVKDAVVKVISLPLTVLEVVASARK
jgi:hypothetical protein